MTADRDLYAALGLTSHATQQEIRRAYRTLVRQHHPDARPVGDPPDNAASNITLQQAISAYTVLGDPARRALYDRHRTPHQSSTRIRVRTVPRCPPGLADRPPIQAGPVRWQRTR